MIYEPNTHQHRKGDLVLEDSDAKEPKMLMRVVGYSRDGLCKTQYIFKDRQRKIWKNPIQYLHRPEQWLHGADRWEYLSLETLQSYQQHFERVRWWNHNYSIGQCVITTSADGGFETTTGGKAKLENGYGHIWLNKTADNRGGWWNIQFVRAIPEDMDNTIS